MMFHFLASAVVGVHLAFVIFVVLGGFLVARWRGLAWVHLPCAIYGAAIEIGRWTCPLTPLENTLRRAAGEAGYTGGFVEHHLLPVLYPEPLPAWAPWALAAIVVVMNAIAYGTAWARSRASTTVSGMSGGTRAGPR